MTSAVTGHAQLTNIYNLIAENIAAQKENSDASADDIAPSAKNIASSEQRPDVKDFADFAKQSGMLNTILHGQSRRVGGEHGDRPLLSAPAKKEVEKTDEEQTVEYIKLSASLQTGRNANQLEWVAAFASTLFNSQINGSQTNNRSGENSKFSAGSDVGSAIASPTPKLSHPPVAGGTDITAADAVSPGFINVMGDMKLLELNNKLIVTLNTAEADASKMAANSSRRTVAAAERAGNKGIAAAKQNLNGALSAGGLGVAGQGVATGRSMRALGKESESIKNNLGVKNSNERTRQQSSDLVGKNNQVPLDDDKMSSSTAGKIGISNAPLARESMDKDLEHRKALIHTQKVRITSEYISQMVNSGQGMIKGGFEVAAAGESKAAELARADQNVNNEVSGTQQQTAKKTAETKAALSQAFESTLINNNSAVSAVADRMR